MSERTGNFVIDSTLSILSMICVEFKRIKNINQCIYSCMHIIYSIIVNIVKNMILLLGFYYDAITHDSGENHLHLNNIKV